MAAGLPSDALLDILSRMPVKSLFRFRSVCKLWCSYIDDPYLATIHDDKLAILEEPIMLLTHYLYRPTVCKINFSYIIKSTVQELPATSFLTRLSCSLKIISNNEPTNALEVIKHPSLENAFNRFSPPPVDLVLGSCNGLLLVRTVQDGFHHTVFAVIHPLRKELHMLPPIKLTPHFLYTKGRKRECCGIGFDASTNTYKVVCVSVSKHEYWISTPEQIKEHLSTMVHVIGTNTWREIPQVPHYPMEDEGVFLEGCLHWLVSYYQRTKVVLFDLKSEEFGLIDHPPREIAAIIRVSPSGYIRNHHLVNLSGELGYVYQFMDFKIEVWVLMKDRQWVLRYQLPHKRPLPYNHNIYVLGCWNKDGDILLTADKTRGQLFVYNVKTGILQKGGWIDENVHRVQMYQGSLGSLFSIHGAYSIKY